MINFCTLFDSHYSAKGLAMYYSLLRHCPSFHLFIFAFDDELVIVLNKMKLKDVTVITLKEFEDEELLAVKPTRTAREYCWTCSSSTILYCLEHFDIPSCTYLDSDLFFFADPTVLIDEMGDDDVLITEHRYSPQYDQTATSGKYCVQFVTFKNNANGLHLLKWWRNACLEWCYAKLEDGKFGDQKYLDDWPTRFKGVHVLQHLGGGVAPWNMQQYEFCRVNNSIEGKELFTGKTFPVVFFHFHYLLCYKKNNYREFLLTVEFYLLSENVRKHLYNIYLIVLRQSYNRIKRINRHIDCLPAKNLQEGWDIICKRIIKFSFSPNNYYAYWITL